MEYDRFQQNSILFIIGITALLISLSLFAFSFYIFPFLLWDWVYDVPAFVLVWREWLIEGHQFTHTGASWLVLLLFVTPALICGYVSYFASNYIDNRLYKFIPEKTALSKRKFRQDVQDTLVFLLKLLGLAILVLVIISIIQWISAVPTPAA
jgi:hypothetical protein